MQLSYNGKDYEIVIEKKRGNRRIYIRVKSDLKIYVTCPLLTSNFTINKMIKDNYSGICKMIDSMMVKHENNEGFYYLGKKYIPIYSDGNSIEFKDDYVYIGNDFDIDKWYKMKAKELFSERLEYHYENFTKKIPHPTLRIRSMKTRWGVCNIITYKITLNLELIKRDVKYLDYVCIHELSHLIHGDHSRSFWKLVEENMSDYKEYRKGLANFL